MHKLSIKLFGVEELDWSYLLRRMLTLIEAGYYT